jgi:hypothetical protein
VRSPSPATSLLLEELLKLESSRAIKRQIEILQQLAAANEPAVIPDLTRFALWTPSAVAEATTEALRALFAIVDAEDVAWLDQAVRDRLRWGDSYAPSELAFIRDIHDPSLKLLSFHFNGYTREAAVNRLSESSEGWEVPYLLLRVNDWVHEVREAALRAVRHRLAPSYAVHFARNLVLINRVRETRRADHGAIIDAIFGLLSDPSAEVAMLQAAASARRRTQRAILRFLNDRGVGLEAAMANRDPVIRGSALRAMARLNVPPSSRAIMHRLADDRSPAVRLQVLFVLAKFFDEEKSRLERALTDRNASVRNAARYLLRDAGIDFAEWYRAALNTASSPRSKATAIDALSEAGTRADALSLNPFLRDPSPQVRRAALRGVMRLDPDGHEDDAVAMIDDPSRGVSNAARTALRKRVASLGRERLLQLFQSGASVHARNNALTLMKDLPKWDALVCLLTANSSADEEIVERARTYIVEWNRHYNRNQLTPSRDQIERIDALLGADVEIPAARDILFALRLYR